MGRIRSSRSLRSYKVWASSAMSRTMARTKGKAALASATVKYFLFGGGFFLGMVLLLLLSERPSGSFQGNLPDPDGTEMS